jgi:glutaredoxin
MPRPTRVVLYTRQGCCLCDQAAELLVRHGLTPEQVDIDADSILREQFTDCVPVVEIDGVIRFRGVINELLLRRLLQG